MSSGAAKRRICCCKKRREADQEPPGGCPPGFRMPSAIQVNISWDAGCVGVRGVSVRRTMYKDGSAGDPTTGSYSLRESPCTTSAWGLDGYGNPISIPGHLNANLSIGRGCAEGGFSWLADSMDCPPDTPPNFVPTIAAGFRTPFGGPCGACGVELASSSRMKWVAGPSFYDRYGTEDDWYGTQCCGFRQSTLGHPGGPYQWMCPLLNEPNCDPAFFSPCISKELSEAIMYAS